MRNINQGIKVFSIIFVIYGALNLLNYTSYNDFAVLCSGLPRFLVVLTYSYGVAYGIVGILCGTKIMKLENWARKTAIGFVLASLVIGLFLTPVVFNNTKTFYAEKMMTANISADDFTRTFLLFTIIFTLFEISFVYYFTRPSIISFFKREGSAI